jgi:anti-sigma B factor antagonist
MELAVREQGDIRIIRIEGELDGESAPAAEAALQGLMLEGDSKFLLNLEQLSYINHAGLRVLLVAAEGLRPNGGEIRICKANATVMEIFEVAGFTAIIQCCMSEDEALAGF